MLVRRSATQFRSVGSSLRALSGVRAVGESRRGSGVMRVLSRFDSLGILLVNLRTVRDEQRYGIGEASERCEHKRGARSIG